MVRVERGRNVDERGVDGAKASIVTLRLGEMGRTEERGEDLINDGAHGTGAPRKTD